MKWVWIIAGRVFVLLMFVGMFVVDIFILPVLLLYRLFKSILGRLYMPKSKRNIL